VRLLLVEDDPRVAQPLTEALMMQHYTVDLAMDGEAGWQYIEAIAYDLILLDVMLPKLDGIALCRRLRSQRQMTPVLMLTARDGSTDKVLGLDAGADDYVVKPFDLPELTARIRALLRRSHASDSPVLSWQALSLDPSRCQVTYAGKALELTPKEYAILELLLRNGDRILSRARMIDNLWQLTDPPGEETVKFHIKELRKKLR